ncbi:MAG: universal stress protein [Nocardioides sp.]|nr:universal stress protein [Nocardioides sp.]
MTYTVCVGVDGSEPSLDALRFAIAEASVRGGEVRVLTTWWLANSLPGTVDVETEKYQQQATLVQEAALATVLEDYDDPPTIHRLVVRGTASEALVLHSRNDDHLVVGSHHKGVLKRFVESSVSTYCIRHSRIPVTVVPHLAPALTDVDPRDPSAQD